MTLSRPQASLGGRAASGVIWLTAQTWATRLGGFVTMAILARLLTPGDFGTVALALAVLPVVYLIADLGFTTYLMQADYVDSRRASTAFWLSSATGLLLSVSLALSAPLLAAIAGVPEAAPVIAAIASVVFIVALAATPIALLRREMRFRALSIQGAAAAVIGQVAALIVAFSGGGAWALVVQAVLVQIASLVMAWWAARWWPRLLVSLRELRTMLSFGWKVITVDLIATLRLWVENAIITRVLSVSSLGEFGIAQRLVQTARDLSGAAIAPVSTVAFAKMRDEPERLFDGYRRAVGLSFAVTAPALAYLLVAAPLVVPIVFGDQWAGSIVPVQALSVAGIFALAATLDHGLMYGMGRPGLWLTYAVVVELATLGTTIAVVQWGIGAVSWGLAAVSAIAGIARWVMVAHLLRTSGWRIAAMVLGPLGILSISVLAGEGVRVLLVAVPEILAALVVGVVMIGIHVLAVRLLAPSTFAELWGLLRRQLSSARRRNTSDDV